MKQRDERGLTLVETVVTLAISSILLLILTDGFGNWQVHRHQVLAENELAVNLNHALGEMTNDLQQAVWVVPQSDAERLVLYREDGDKICYTLADDPMSDEHPYDLAGKVLYRAKNDGQRQPVANFLAQMTISYQTKPGQATIMAVHIWLSGQAVDKTITAERTLVVGGYYWRKEKMEMSR